MSTSIKSNEKRVDTKITRVELVSTSTILISRFGSGCFTPVVIRIIGKKRTVVGPDGTEKLLHPIVVGSLCSKWKEEQVQILLRTAFVENSASQTEMKIEVACNRLKLPN